jgi:hypothetical protein
MGQHVRIAKAMPANDSQRPKVMTALAIAGRSPDSAEAIILTPDEDNPHPEIEVILPA